MSLPHKGACYFRAFSLNFTGFTSHIAGVHAAGQERADLNIGDLVRLHTVVERVGDAVDPGVQIRLFVCVEVHVPVALHLEFAVLVGEVVRRRQLVNALEESFVAGGVLEGEVVFQRRGVEDFLEVGVAQEALDLRAEQQCLAHLRIVQGLDAEEIPCAEQRLFLLIPDDKGEHAPQLIQQLALCDRRSCFI